MSDLPEKYTAGGAFPKSLGGCVDLYKEVRDIRLLMEKGIAPVRARETELREMLIQCLSASDDTGVAGKRYRAQRVTKVRPQAEEWGKVQAYILETGRFDLLQRRLSDKAVTDMWDAGETVPGVVRVNVVDISVTKI